MDFGFNTLMAGLFLIVFVLTRYPSVRKELLQMFRDYNSTDKSQNPSLSAITLKTEYEKYFLGRFSYYDRLPDELKIKFLSRIHQFLQQKTFAGRGELAVTDEMKARIAGAAIQLTFGLEDFTFEYFKHIFIFPDIYYSHMTGKRHKGEANPLGAIVLSWKDFEKGYNIPDDKFNLGLHEMAHALELEDRLDTNFHSKFSGYYEKWKKVSQDEYEKLHDKQNSFLRQYGGTNREEFFAVCVEHFFEASEEFKRELPEIYDGLCELLGQDPLRKFNS